MGVRNATLEGVVIMFNGFYKGKKVLVTGHTGFKGSWLCQWLLKLGAEVAGYSLYVPSAPANYEVLDLIQTVQNYVGDIRDEETLSQALKYFQPEVVFHLAAQSIVYKSYDEPRLTFETNMMGMVNIIEAAQSTPSVKALILITSDKCYENVEWEYGYREIDRLGGNDPYSASKACAEIVAQSYYRSFFSKPNSLLMATTRAGNVIGGGDWADNRIVPDSIRAWSENKPIVVRSPNATRPWQHVLEPLSGYLWLVATMLEGHSALSGEAFNFGPTENMVFSVGDLIEEMQKSWQGAQYKVGQQKGNRKEASLLKLDCSKAFHRLLWQPTLNFHETVKMVTQWYWAYYQEGNNKMNSYTLNQIEHYENLAGEKKRVWAL